jgi:type II secretory pathway pseudopilin PulG
MTPNLERRADLRRQAGFTLVELLVALGVMVIVILGVLLLFDANTKLARAQTHLADMQQSQRVAQTRLVSMARMAGRGFLPVGTLPAGISLAVRDQVGLDGVSPEIAVGYTDSPVAATGTDIVTIRGVINVPIYQLNHANPTTFTVGIDGTDVIGTVQIAAVSPTGVAQSTAALVQAIEADIPEALVLTSSVDDRIFAVVEVDLASASTDVSDPDLITVGFRWDGGEHSDAYQALSGSVGPFPPALTSVAFVGVLEEYRYYVREHDVGGTTRNTLCEARLFPGTEIPYQPGPTFNAADPAIVRVEVADDILDLQAALGVDSNADGVVADNFDAADEWLYNHPDDDDTSVAWNVAGRRLFYLRLSTLARTPRPDWNYLSPPIVNVENHAWGESPGTPADPAVRQRRMHRRRVLSTVVDLRNLS